MVRCEKLKLMKKLVKPLKINKTFGLSGKVEIHEKTRQTAENKQTFGLTGKIEINGKTRQNAENKHSRGQRLFKYIYFNLAYFELTFIVTSIFLLLA